MNQRNEDAIRIENEVFESASISIVLSAKLRDYMQEKEAMGLMETKWGMGGFPHTFTAHAGTASAVLLPHISKMIAAYRRCARAKIYLLTSMPLAASRRITRETLRETNPRYKVKIQLELWLLKPANSKQAAGLVYRSFRG